MLAKVAPPTNDFATLARYLVHGKPGTVPDPKRVAWTFTQNLPTDDPELAASYMTATAALSPRTRKAAYHMMIAWHERERPTPDQMQAIARQTLELAGLAEHEALIMGHGDKRHAHLHILLNRVHPVTGRAWKTSHDYARFDRIMQSLAGQHGFEFTPAHSYNPELTDDCPKLPNSRATYAAKRGHPTRRRQWSKRTARVVSASLSEDLDHASTLDDVMATMTDHGVRLERKGKGFIVGNDTSYAKLSSLNLSLSAYGTPSLLALADLFKTSPRRRSIWTVDGVDIARALKTFGLADEDDVRAAIDTAVQERQKRRTQFKAPSSTTLLSPVFGLIRKHHQARSRSEHHLSR